ncbi:MAG: hypothetical protein JSS91_01465 [Bacteroidetes bacterium]|nr:hypothetical protein [Bacteroidota bacterium]
MKNLLLSFLFISVSFGCLHSQVLYDVRSLAMGNTSVSNSYELDAFNQNPANILFQRGNNNAKFYFNALTTFQFLNNSNYLSIKFLNDNFAEDGNGSSIILTDAEKMNIINSASDQKTTFTASVKILSFIYNHPDLGTFGISIDDRIAADFFVSRDFLDLGLYGNQPDRVYDLSKNRVNGYWTRQLNLSLAKMFKIKKNKLFESVSVGLSVKPQFGLYYFETKKNSLTFETTSQNVIRTTGETEFLYSGISDEFVIKFPSGNAGFGFGFDGGVNVALKNFTGPGKFNFGLSIADAGYINWTKNNATYYNNGNFVLTDITNKEQRDSLINIIRTTKTPVSDFSINLPAVLRLGVNYKLFKKADKTASGLELGSISAEYIQGLTDNLGGSKDPRFGLGAEFNAGSVVSLRSGVSFGSSINTVVGLGIGIDTGPVLIDLGTRNIMSIFNPEGTSNLSAGLNIKFKVN